MFKNGSFLSVDDLNTADIETLFKVTKSFEKKDKEQASYEGLLDFNQTRSKTALLFFAESSTRTRISFELACYKLGMNVINFSDIKSSSMIKGETLEVTLSTLEALHPSVLIVRHKGSQSLVEGIFVPVINAGFGAYEHPTQALIDAYTIKQERGQIKNEKVLIVGDVLHSRVSNSNLKLLKKLGAEVAYCSPDSYAPTDPLWKSVQSFKNLNEGVKWASVIMGLRVQKERHNTGIGLTLAEYRDRYHLGSEQLKIFNKDGIILHPGPYIYGVEISENITSDSRCRISLQVSNGVYVRSALLSMLLNFKVNELS